GWSVRWCHWSAEGGQGCVVEGDGAGDVGLVVVRAGGRVGAVQLDGVDRAGGEGQVAGVEDARAAARRQGGGGGDRDGAGGGAAAAQGAAVDGHGAAGGGRAVGPP